jgi:Cysteine rich repeat
MAGTRIISAESFNHREGVMHMNNAIALPGVQMKWFAVLAGVFCLAVATAASAEETARPCRDDAARLCQDVKPGRGAIAKCLKEHASELSPACKDNMVKAKKKIKEKAKEVKEACNDDAKNFCKDEKPGGGNIMKCLKQHESELSPECKEQMVKPRRRK